jgi:hypothetical protein
MSVSIPSIPLPWATYIRISRRLTHKHHAELWTVPLLLVGAVMLPCTSIVSYKIFTLIVALEGSGMLVVVTYRHAIREVQITKATGDVIGTGADICPFAYFRAV